MIMTKLFCRALLLSLSCIIASCNSAEPGANNDPRTAALVETPAAAVETPAVQWETCDFGEGFNEAVAGGSDSVALNENAQELFGEEYPLACNEDPSASPTYGIANNIIINLKLCSENLIKNPFFKLVDTTQQLGISAWNYEHIYESPLPFSLINDKFSFFSINYLQIKNNSIGKHFITQPISVIANKRYTISMLYELTSNDYRNPGIFIYKGDEVLAQKTSSIVTRKPELLSETFISDSDEEITVKIGFDDGINSELKIYYVEMIEVSPEVEFIRYEKTPKKFIEKCVNWNQLNLNASVSDITDYTLSILANPDENERLKFKQKYSPYLTSWISAFIDYYTTAVHLSEFCQVASLSAAEATSLFGIQTRQWHWTDNNGIGQHQFFEYFDAKSNKWIVVDPYYSIQYAAQGELLSVEDIKRTGIENVSILKMSSRAVFPTDLPTIHSYFSEGILELGISY